MENIKKDLLLALESLFEVAKLEEGDIFVVGCSTSEILGNKIGSSGSEDCAKVVFETINEFCCKHKVYLAAQCCEHLNRAVILEAECAEKYGLEVVCVRPAPKAGGSFATVTYDTLDSPVAVESVRAHAGIDVGGTLIGMHLRAVAVPVRISTEKIGEARIICARTRPKYIGGPRAIYE